MNLFIYLLMIAFASRQFYDICTDICTYIYVCTTRKQCKQNPLPRHHSHFRFFSFPHSLLLHIHFLFPGLPIACVFVKLLGKKQKLINLFHTLIHYKFSRFLMLKRDQEGEVRYIL